METGVGRQYSVTAPPRVTSQVPCALVHCAHCAMHNPVHTMVPRTKYPFSSTPCTRTTLFTSWYPVLHGIAQHGALHIYVTYMLCTEQHSREREREGVSWVGTACTRILGWHCMYTNPGLGLYTNAGTCRALRADVILAICPLSQKGGGRENDDKEGEGE